jgi:outer membrane immunogenic protein
MQALVLALCANNAQIPNAYLTATRLPIEQRQLRSSANVRAALGSGAKNPGDVPELLHWNTRLSVIIPMGWGCMMKKIFLISIGLVALVGSASAADLPDMYTKARMPMEPVYNWNGFYIGLNGGGASSHQCWNMSNFLGLVVAPALGEGCQNATGGVVGGQVGYRWQSYNWVFGVEAQGDWADLKGSNTSAVGLIAGIPYVNQTKIDAIGLFTGQVGYAWSNMLLYVKGGAAATHNKYIGITAAAINFDNASETRWGGTAGAGLEFRFAPNWTVGFEYSHLFMGRGDISFTSTPAFGSVTSRTDSIKQDVDMGTVRVNYTFGGPLVASY